MKTNLRTFTFCGKTQGCEEPGSYDKLQKKMRLKRKKERKKERKKNGKTNCKEGRGKKPKIQACLNSQLLVKKTKQNNQKQVKKVICLTMKAR